MSDEWVHRLIGPFFTLCAVIVVILFVALFMVG